jgi:hypothetical protein
MGAPKLEKNSGEVLKDVGVLALALGVIALGVELIDRAN